MFENDSEISVRGAREHNLKNVSVDIPRNKMTVITGLSGSGKSSLAFDTIYAEGQRRYVEGLSSYARQFLDQLKKPDVDAVTGLSPSISIEQKTTSTSPRSTVGTVTEIYDYLRLLFARVGTPRCFSCGKPISHQSPKQIAQQILALPEGTKIHVLSPVVKSKKGEYLAEFKKWMKLGFVRARIDGEIIDLALATKLTKSKRHDIDLFVDRLIINPKVKNRLTESIENGLRLAGGFIKIENLSDSSITEYSSRNACHSCGTSFPEIEPRLFSFNNPRGACETCNGLGYIGTEGEEEDDDEGYEYYDDCPKCQGLRLKTESLSVFIGEKNIAELSELSCSELLEFFKEIKIEGRQKQIAEKVLKEINSRLTFLTDVGVGYLSMSRPSYTLSGGESQRIRLATQIGSSLVGVLYVLDEPSIGLHPRDHNRLLGTLRKLCELGNTVLMVEHDEDTIRSADFVLDLGPQAGKKGGELLSRGTPNQIAADPKSVTGAYLKGSKSIPIPKKRRSGSGKFVTLKGARGNNLKNVDVSIPLGCLNLITGVSGSGKSTLIIDTLYEAMCQQLYEGYYEPEEHDQIEGLENIDKVIDIDQSPIGRTPRSNPATYVGLFTLIRDVFSQLPDSKMRGFKPGRFSFNVKGGRCEACEGAGTLKIEMHFLPNVFVPCDTCQGKRYNRETLEVKFKDKNIAEVLAMDVDEAVVFFENIPAIRQKLEVLQKVGLGYIGLGQSSTTLSGGEAQRIKLSRELSKRSTGKTMYILDEPTTGLHFQDIEKLLEILHALVDQGNTVIVIEHQLDVIKVADNIIDLGPEGGIGGGTIVAAGPPEQVSKVSGSHTGHFLKKIMP